MRRLVVLGWDTLEMHGFKSEKQQYKQEVMSETTNVDFKAITHEWEKSKHLYDVLKMKCHPDLYTGKQSEVATQLFLHLLWFSAEGITQ